ncbi:MAG: hypothetical protein CM1200mP2_11940 [Planctomycetaceae bacterium]|nr:MAG: hypothetical protein CM1200mP2_11940 [Planctomycetaceae bacterium]
MPFVTYRHLLARYSRSVQAATEQAAQAKAQQVWLADLERFIATYPGGRRHSRGGPGSWGPPTNLPLVLIKPKRGIRSWPASMLGHLPENVLRGPWCGWISRETPWLSPAGAWQTQRFAAMRTGEGAAGGLLGHVVQAVHRRTSGTAGTVREVSCSGVRDSRCQPGPRSDPRSRLHLVTPHHLGDSPRIRGLDSRLARNWEFSLCPPWSWWIAVGRWSVRR